MELLSRAVYLYVIVGQFVNKRQTRCTREAHRVYGEAFCWFPAVPKRPLNLTAYPALQRAR